MVVTVRTSIIMQGLQFQAITNPSTAVSTCLRPAIRSATLSFRSLPLLHSPSFPVSRPIGLSRTWGDTQPAATVIHVGKGAWNAVRVNLYFMCSSSNSGFVRCRQGQTIMRPMFSLRPFLQRLPACSTDAALCGYESRWRQIAIRSDEKTYYSEWRVLNERSYGEIWWGASFVLPLCLSVGAFLVSNAKGSDWCQLTYH